MAETAAAALRTATDQLKIVSDTPRLDAELLMAHALAMAHGEMLLGLRNLHEPRIFAALVQRRLAHEPVAYITGTREFWSLPFRVTPDVLIPRADSETLVAQAVTLYPADAPLRILDLGTGSGALLLAALHQFPNSTGVGIDASDAALAVAKGNADTLGLTARAQFVCVDWREPGWVAKCGGPFDLVLTNPPYIARETLLMRDVQDHEPHLALYAGNDGLDAYRTIVPALVQLMTPTGHALLEIGYDQRIDVTALAQGSGYAVACIADLGGNDRVLHLHRHDGA